MLDMSSDNERSRYIVDNGLAPTTRQAVIWINVGLGDWNINSALGLVELKKRLI